MTPTEQYDAFLSYARADDRAFAAALYARLTSAGYRIWWDARHMPNRGETFYREIQHAIDASARLIAVIGPAAVASRYVRAEWDYAQLVSKVVVPVLRKGENSDIPPELRRECSSSRDGFAAPSIVLPGSTRKEMSSTSRSRRPWTSGWNGISPGMPSAMPTSGSTTGKAHLGRLRRPSRPSGPCSPRAGRPKSASG